MTLSMALPHPSDKPKFYECNICGQHHFATGNGRCRQDAARFYPKELDAKYGEFGWTEVDTPERRYDVVHPETFGLLGSVSLNNGPRKDVNGWWFISHVSSHANGRKPRPTASAAIPPWAKKMGAKLV